MEFWTSDPELPGSRSTSLDLRKKQHVDLITAICVAGLFVLAFLVTKRKRLRLPPGPPGWPVIGNILRLGKMPHHALMDLSKKYGPIMYLKLGLLHTVVVSSPDMARVILRTQDHVFASRPPTLLGEVYFDERRDLFSLPLGPRFRFLRKLCMSDLLNPKRVRELEGVRKDELLRMLERFLDEGCGTAPVLLDVGSKLSELLFNLTIRLLFNKRYSSALSGDTMAEMRRMTELIRNINSAAGSFVIADYIPFLRKLDLGGFEAKFAKYKTQMDAFLIPIIEQHRQNSKAETQGHNDQMDFVDLLLSLQNEKSDKDLDSQDVQESAEDSHSLSERHIRCLLQDLVLAGVDTSVSTLLWVIAELMRHPEVREKTQKELDSVVGKGRLVEESDLVNLPYLQAVVKESYRLHPTGAMLAPHYSVVDTKVAGYDIPEKTMVFVNVYAIGRDPELWKNPLKFDPERFLNSSIDYKGHHFELLPFGSGRRSCAGMNLGAVIVELTLAVLLQTFDFSLPKGMNPLDIDVEEEFGSGIHKLHPLKVLVASRLASHVYAEAGIKIWISG